MEAILTILLYLSYALGPVAIIGLVVWATTPAKKSNKQVGHMNNYHRSREWQHAHLTEEAIRERYCK